MLAVLDVITSHVLRSDLVVFLNFIIICNNSVISTDAADFTDVRVYGSVTTTSTNLTDLINSDPV